MTLHRLPFFASCVLAAGCSAGPTTVPDPVDQVLAAARRSIGWADADSAIIALRASVTWAGPAYEVEILSSGSGNVRLAFVGGAVLGVAGDSGVAVVSPGTATVLTDSLETFLRGHDLFFNLVAPHPRLRSLRVGDTTGFAGQAAIVIVGVDAVGAEVRLYYAVSDSVPLGYAVEDHLRGAGTVTTEIRSWTERDGHRIPSQVQFRQGDEVFDYVIRSFDLLRSAPDSLFLARD